MNNEKPPVPYAIARSPKLIMSDTQLRIMKMETEADRKEKLFAVRPANRWIEIAATRPVPKMLFGELWFERELCILFADTNLGKSILAVQIADSISRGVPIAGFSMEAKAQPVLYFDFELYDKQFQARYSKDNRDPYLFADTFYRAEMNPDASYLDKGYERFEDYLNAQIEYQVKETNVAVIIIDNLTYLRQETEQAKDALPLMKALNNLKKAHKLSMLVLAHTPKRDQSKPLTVNDLQGSKHLSNFADSIFAIGASYTDHRLRYIKQIKQRNTEKVYDEENVCICQIAKPANFLHFELLRHDHEQQHLKVLSVQDRTDLIANVKKLSTEGRSQREIATELGISVGAVNKYLRK